MIVERFLSFFCLFTHPRSSALHDTAARVDIFHIIEVTSEEAEAERGSLLAILSFTYLGHKFLKKGMLALPAKRLSAPTPLRPTPTALRIPSPVNNHPRWPRGLKTSRCPWGKTNFVDVILRHVASLAAFICLQDCNSSKGCHATAHTHVQRTGPRQTF